MLNIYIYFLFYTLVWNFSLQEEIHLRSLNWSQNWRFSLVSLSTLDLNDSCAKSSGRDCVFLFLVEGRVYFLLSVFSFFRTRLNASKAKLELNLTKFAVARLAAAWSAAVALVRCSCSVRVRLCSHLCALTYTRSLFGCSVALSALSRSEPVGSAAQPLERVRWKSNARVVRASCNVCNFQIWRTFCPITSHAPCNGSHKLNKQVFFMLLLRQHSLALALGQHFATRQHCSESNSWAWAWRSFGSLSFVSFFLAVLPRLSAEVRLWRAH